jgi:hypothetical protein
MMANIKVLPQRTAAELLWDRVTELAGLDLPGLWPRATAAPSVVAGLDGEICRADGTKAVALR